MKPFRTYKETQQFARSTAGDFSILLRFYGKDQSHQMSASFERHECGRVAVFWRSGVYAANAAFIYGNSDRLMGKVAA